MHESVLVEIPFRFNTPPQHRQREQYIRNVSIHTYSLTPRCRVLLEQLTGSQTVKKFPAFYGTPRFITAFTSVRHPSLSWASSIKSIPPSKPWSSKWSLSFRFPHQNPVYLSLLHTRYIPCPSHSSRFYYPNSYGWGVHIIHIIHIINIIHIIHSTFTLLYMFHIVRVIKWRRMRWAGHVARMGEERVVYRVLVGKPEGKRTLGRPRCRWLDNIRVDLWGEGCV